MRLAPLALGLLIVSSASAQSDRPIFPDDYTPSACASTAPCESFEPSKMQSAAATFLGLTLDQTWMKAHLAEIESDLAPLCKKRGTCFAHPANSFTFCDDVMVAEAKPICERRYSEKRDREQCRVTLEVYLLGIEHRAKPLWEKAQRCAKSQPQTHAKPLDVWVTPAAIPPGFKNFVTFYATDPDRHVPVFAKLTFEGQQHYSPSNPTGAAAAFYPMKLPFTYIRVPNAQGHEDLVAPNVTVSAPGYPATTFRLPSPPPKVIVEMVPATLRPGENKVVVKAHDASSGKPVELRIVMGDTPIGSSNEPLTITLPKKGPRPEIWATSLFNRYSDVVILPARR
jgi:hypothetical protein